MENADTLLERIIDAVRRQQFAPVYLLMGDESYYIDRLSDFITANALTEDERDFNLTTVYCTRETSVADIVMAARRFPVMANRQLIIVKEAQNLLKLEDLCLYLSQPQQTTILVICYKNGFIDRRKKIVSVANKVGVVYESKKLREGMLPAFVKNYLARKQTAIDDDACLLLAESVGTDLSRLAGEMDKLIIALPKETKRVDKDLVFSVVDVSKEYNAWSLRTAVAERDILRANRIILHLDPSDRNNQPVVVVAILFNFFAAVMQAYYSPDRSEAGMMRHLELRQPWQLREYTTAMKHYSAMKTMLIIGKLRESDCKLKGIGRGGATDEDILRELLFFIFH